MSRWYLFALAGLAAISPAPLSARTMYLSGGGDDNSQPGPGATFRTVGRAFEALAAGDTLIVREGSHLGGQIVTITGTAAAPIVIRGESLSAAIDSAARDNRDALRLEGCSYIVIESLTFRKGGRGGLAIYGSDHVTVRGCRMGDNGIWGIITSFADDLWLEGNECWGSKIEHGIYHANSGDRFVIRGNRSHHNSGCGIHMNGDPEIGGGDGVLNFGIVENNIVYENGGGKGGAGINMTHVQDIIVRHNLLYRNHAGGITFYQDAGASAQGSKRGLFLNNTIVFRQGQGRNAVNIGPTSEKAVAMGNILVTSGSNVPLQVYSEHLSTIRSDYNLCWGSTEERFAEPAQGPVQSLAVWRSATGNDLRSRVADPGFALADSADYTLRPGSPALEAGAPPDSVRAALERLGGCEWLLARLDSLPRQDLRGYPRPAGAATDAGAFEMSLGQDFNGDGLLDVRDVPAMIRLARRQPADPWLDLSGDGRFSIIDALLLVLRIRTSG